MLIYDDTQRILTNHLEATKHVFEDLLHKRYGGGQVHIVTSLDLGFPHDVIRVAGGFATGAYVQWECKEALIPVDTCVNDCAVTFFELDRDIDYVFENEYYEKFLHRMENATYKLNFQRGNHFIAFVRSMKTGKPFLVFHSSASEFKDSYNGLYPTECNYVHECVKIHEYNNRYLRYVEGKDAEMFWHIAQNLPSFNEARHEFIASTLLNHQARILAATTSHHYYMPTSQSVVMGGHITTAGMELPLLTNPGENIILLKYSEAKNQDVRLPCDGLFITPHGLGKCDVIVPTIEVSSSDAMFSLDGRKYSIHWGESLRDHENLILRKFDRERVFKYFDDLYEYEVVDEFVQIASINKKGIQMWNRKRLKSI